MFQAYKRGFLIRFTNKHIKRAPGRDLLASLSVDNADAVPASPQLDSTEGDLPTPLASKRICSKRPELGAAQRPTATQETAKGDPSVVASLKQASKWPTYACDVLAKETSGDGKTLLDEYADCLRGGYSVSSSFSGIGSTFVGADIMWSAASKLYKDLPQARHEFAIEISPESQKELIMLPNAPKHLFSNINQFWVEPIRKYVSSIEDRPPRSILEIMTPIVKSGKSVRDSGWCLRCGKFCRLPETDSHEAGTPCVDFSAQGKEDGFEGKSTIALLCWISMRLLFQEAHVVQENVRNMVISVFSEFLGDIYFIDVEEEGFLTSVEDSASYGFPCTRRRKWTHMRHKVKTLALRRPLNMFTKLFYRKPMITWRAPGFPKRLFTEYVAAKFRNRLKLKRNPVYSDHRQVLMLRRFSWQTRKRFKTSLNGLAAA